MIFPKYYIGPMSQNVVDCVIKHGQMHSIGLIPSRRQVDFSGGYVNGWNTEIFSSYEKKKNSTVLLCRDHGGAEQGQVSDDGNKSFETDAQYLDLIHIDPFRVSETIYQAAEKTGNMIEKLFGINPNIMYEVGTEEVHGGLADMTVFKKFLELLKDGLQKIGLDYVWPSFIVGKVGTDLHTSTFNPAVAKKIVEIAKDYNSYIKGHYTDFVSNPEDYPKSGMGAANVGPEFTILEYDGLSELCAIEDKLYKENKVAGKSNFIKILEEAVLKSGRWKKWLQNDEKDFKSLNNKRKEWIVKTSCRYVWALPEVRCAQNKLYRNLELNGIDAENWVIMKIEESMDKYFGAFNLININEKLNV